MAGTNSLATFKAPASYSPGTTSIVLDNVPTGSLGSGSKMYWYIDPWTYNCERLFVSAKSGNVLTLSRPTKLTHSTNAMVIAINNGCFSPHVYGTYQPVDLGRGFADEWMYMQRIIMEHQGIKVRVGGIGVFGGIIPGAPLLLMDQTFMDEGYLGARTDKFDPNCIQTGIPNDYPTGGSTLVKGAGSVISFNGIASSDTIVLPVGASPLTVGFPVIMGNPYNEALPGGITRGRHYLVKSWNSSTRVATLSEISTPGTVLPITSDGSGYIFYDFLSEIKIGWDRVFPSGSGAGFDSMQVTLKPGSYTKDIRSYGGVITIGGRASVHTNLEVQQGIDFPVGPEVATLHLFGTAHEIDYINQNGGSIAMRVGPSEGIHIKMSYEEGTTYYGTDVTSGCHGLTVEQQMHSRALGVAYLRDLVTDGSESYDTGVINVGVTNYPLYQIAGSADFKTQIGQYNWQDGDTRNCMSGLTKTTHGATMKNKRVILSASGGGGATTNHSSGRSDAGIRHWRDPTIMTLPDPSGLMPGFTQWISKENPASGTDSGTITVKDHLGTTLVVMTGSGELRFFRYFPESSTYSASYWHMSYVAPGSKVEVFV